MKFFACSDIHSGYTPWINALNAAGFDIDNPDHMIVLCGDLFDRMSETVAVYEFAKHLIDRNKLIYIKGNHESLLFDCYESIKRGKIPGSHHFHNGTVKTICQLCGQNEWIIYDPEWYPKILNKLEEVLQFISKNTVNYFETANHVFVHACLPRSDKEIPWRNASDAAWSEAMWGNPFLDYLSDPLEDKTVVFGHWHCSFGWAYAEHRSEFGQDAKFDTFFGDGYIGLDGCVAHSGQCNVHVIEDDLLEEIKGG